MFFHFLWRVILCLQFPHGKTYAQVILHTSDTWIPWPALPACRTPACTWGHCSALPWRGLRQHYLVSRYCTAWQFTQHWHQDGWKGPCRFQETLLAYSKFSAHLGTHRMWLTYGISVMLQCLCREGSAGSQRRQELQEISGVAQCSLIRDIQGGQ